MLTKKQIKMNYKSLITDIQNFPIDGVNFKDISPLLASSKFDEVIHKMGELVRNQITGLASNQEGLFLQVLYL